MWPPEACALSSLLKGIHLGKRTNSRADLHFCAVCGAFCAQQFVCQNQEDTQRAW